MFETHAVTEAGPGRKNEDHYLVSADWAIVLDGVAPSPGQDNGCVHGVRWFVNRLAAWLAAGMSMPDAGKPLTVLLTDAIAHTSTEHGPSCDLTKPLTPAATVALARRVGDRLDWLALGDVSIAWQRTDGQTDSVTDDRIDQLKDAPVVVADVRRYDPEFVKKVRNQPGGFWVAASDPRAATEALTGSLALDEVKIFGLFTDGLSRLNQRYGHPWSEIFDMAHVQGMQALIELVRTDERTDPDPTRWRGKPHDDATAVIARVPSPRHPAK